MKEVRSQLSCRCQELQPWEAPCQTDVREFRERRQCASAAKRTCMTSSCSWNWRETKGWKEFASDFPWYNGVDTNTACCDVTRTLWTGLPAIFLDLIRSTVIPHASRAFSCLRSWQNPKSIHCVYLCVQVKHEFIHIFRIFKIIIQKDNSRVPCPTSPDATGWAAPSWIASYLKCCSSLFCLTLSLQGGCQFYHSSIWSVTSRARASASPRPLIWLWVAMRWVFVVDCTWHSCVTACLVPLHVIS